jgi:hypothetical protein
MLWSAAAIVDIGKLTFELSMALMLAEYELMELNVAAIVESG